MHKQTSPEQWSTTYTKQGVIVYRQIVNKYNSQSMYLSIYHSIYLPIFYLPVSVLKICPAYNLANFRNCVNWSYEVTRMVYLSLSSNEPSLRVTERMDWGWDTLSFFECTCSFLQDKRQLQLYSKVSLEH